LIMYRCLHIARVGLACTVLVWGLSCSRRSDTPSTGHAESYFSLADYFSKEATRLQQFAPTVAKTVTKNGEAEHRMLRIDNWQNELALFIDSDINKPAWQNSYRVDSTATSVTYTSRDPELRTERIIVEKRPDGTVNHIRVVNRVSNMLYQTEERLDYHPDSAYQLVKRQWVRFIGESHYTISGTLK